MVTNINHVSETGAEILGQGDARGIMMDAAAISASAAQTGSSRVVLPATKPLAAEGNRSRRSQVEALLAELLGMGLRKGFFGTMALTLSFHDGNIQHVTKHIEQKVVR